MDEGSFAQVSCIVTKGDQPLTISWSFHGHDISSDLGIITTPLGNMGSSLMITSVGHKHRGTFTCKASNQAGNTTQSVELRVNGASISVTGSHRFFLQPPPVSATAACLRVLTDLTTSSWSSCATACLPPSRYFDARSHRHLEVRPALTFESRDTTQDYYSPLWAGQPSESSFKLIHVSIVLRVWTF